MRVFWLIAFLFFCKISGQVSGISDFLADDYGNFYFTDREQFKIIKTDASGAEIARTAVRAPFRILSVRNPLSIALFSENTQSIIILDQNLTEIERIRLNDLGWVKAVYAPDTQEVWLLVSDRRMLTRYHLRERREISAIPLAINFMEIKDIIIFKDKIYILSENSLNVFNLSGEMIKTFDVSGGKRLQINNSEIFITSSGRVESIMDDKLVAIYQLATDEEITLNSEKAYILKNCKIIAQNFKKNTK